MDDREIVALFFMRSETALEECRKKYGRYCRYIALRVLNSEEDAAEIVNDALYKAWQTIPPYRPEDLKAYLGMISRQLAQNAYNKNHADRRGGAFDDVLIELDDCLIEKSGDICDEIALKNALDGFLSSLPKKQRIIFVRRYWYSCSISEIAQNCRMSEGGVKMLLMRIREKLKKYLKKEGIIHEK